VTGFIRPARVVDACGGSFLVATLSSTNGLQLTGTESLINAAATDTGKSTLRQHFRQQLSAAAQHNGRPALTPSLGLQPAIHVPAAPASTPSQRSQAWQRRSATVLKALEHLRQHAAHPFAVFCSSFKGAQIEAAVPEQLVADRWWVTSIRENVAPATPPLPHQVAAVAAPPRTHARPAPPRQLRQGAAPPPLPPPPSQPSPPPPPDFDLPMPSPPASPPREPAVPEVSL
jgi:hypothetical protein